MNRGELLSLVTVATAGWLRTPKLGQAPSLALGTHETLLRLIQPSDRGSRRSGQSARRERRDLLREINRVSGELVAASKQALDELNDTHCEFTFEQIDDNDNLSVGHFALDEVSLVTDALKALRIAESMRRLRAAEQLRLVDVFHCERDLSFSELHLRDAELEAKHSERDRWEKAVSEERRALAKAERRLSLSGQEWLNRSRALYPTFTSLAASIPVKLELSVENFVLAKVGDWYGNLGIDMYQPFPVDASAPPRRVGQWRRAWARYEDCGQSFRVLAAWLRAMAATDTFRRCQICYRHLGFGMKKFCREHLRTSVQRQRSRQLHISKFYKKIVGSSVASLHDIRSSFTRDVADRAEWPTLKRLASQHVVGALVQPAATLAAYLRRLWPVLTPVLQFRVAAHFEQMLALANAPFQRHAFAGSIEAQENRRLRNAAPEWLGWDGFFRTWFRSAQESENGDAWPLGAGLDVDHPLAKRQPVSLNKMVLDLAHLRSWILVADQFNRHAYLSPKKVATERTLNLSPGDVPPTLAKLGDQFGASAEAVRNALIYAASETKKSGRRERVLPEGLIRLSQLLGSG